MRKLLFILLLITLLGLCAFAEKMDITLKHNEENAAILAEISVSEGGATLGHFGISYNTEKLQPVTYDFKSLPSELPDTNENGKSYLADIAKPVADYITVTNEGNAVKELVNTEKGFILFGWYASKDIGSVLPENNGGRIAVITLKLKDGCSISDISTSDITPVTAKECGSISGWSAGIVLSGLEKKVYTFETDDESKKLGINVTAEFAENKDDTAAESKENTDDTAKDNESSEYNPGETGSETTDKTDDTPSVSETKPQTSKEDFKVAASVYSDKIRITWKNNPALSKEYSYRIVISDKDGDTVRDIKGILPICRSLTVKDLVPNFDFTIKFYLVNNETDAMISHTEELSVKTAIDTKAQPKIFKVTYKVGNGTLYGFDSEEVMFGYCPTKASTTVYPKGDYKFEGWSVDGKTVIDVSKYKIYEDTVFTAVYKKLEASGNSY